MLGLAELLDRKPRQLSGGQRQRVAMGRAIVREPSVFLMDEPLSNLDARLRVQMRAEVSRIQHELEATTIYVTHDQVEAMTMGDRIAVMRNGILQQTGHPQHVYDHPANLFVAKLHRQPADEPRPGATRFAQRRRRGARRRTGARRSGRSGARPPGGSRGTRAGRSASASGPSTSAIRLSPDDGGRSRLRGEVRATEALGSEVLVHLAVSAEPVLTEEVREVAVDVDAAALEQLESEALEQRTIVIGRFETSERLRTGAEIEVAVDSRKLHFFDLETGLAIYGT